MRDDAGIPDELSTAEAAALAGVSARTVRNWIRFGQVDGVQRVDGWRVTRASLEAHLAARAAGEATVVADAEPAPLDDAPPGGAASPALSRAVVETVLSALVAELERARAERDELRRENRDLAGQLGYLRAEVAQRDRQIALLAAPAPRPWWKRLFRG